MRASTIRLIVLALIGVAALTLLVSVRTVLTPFFIGLLIAYLLAPAVAYGERHKLPRGVAVALVYLMLILALVLLGNWLVPRLFAELVRMAESLPAYTTQVQDLIAQAQARYQFVPPSVRQVIEQSAANVGSGLLDILKNAIQGSTGLVSGLVSFAFAWLLAIYFLLDWHKLGDRCLALVPPAHRAVVQDAAADMDKMLGGYLRGMILVASITGLLSGMIVFIAGLRFALLFGLLSAAGEFIPYIGPLAAAAAPVIMAWLRSPVLALKVAIAYIVVQQIQSSFISPRIVGRSLGLHPVVILFALLAGQMLFGMPGMLFAAPVAGLINVAWGHAAPWLFPVHRRVVAEPIAPAPPSPPNDGQDA